MVEPYTTLCKATEFVQHSNEMKSLGWLLLNVFV